MAFEEHCAANTIFIKEDELVDAVYLIANGSFEVAKTTSHANQKISVPVATLEKYDAIGLSQTGFYAHRGLRTATLTSITDAQLIGWKLSEFYQFIKKHTILSACMKETAENMLRMQFIKEITPFAHLPAPFLYELSKEIDQLFFEKDTIIFHEGDSGDTCYLIYSGDVEISIKNEDGSRHTLSILEPWMLFGEMSLISNLPRNATAKMVKPGILLVIKKDQLQQLMKQSQNTADAIIIMAAERSRPMQDTNISIYSRPTDDGQIMYVLKHDKEKTYFQLSPVGLFIWNLLDGKHTIEDITLAVFYEYHAFIPDAITDIIVNLSSAGLIKANSILFNTTSKNQKTTKEKIICYAYRYLFIKASFNKIDEMITKTYHHFFYLFYTPFAKIVFPILTITGFIVFLYCLPTIIAIMSALTLKSSLLLLLSLYLSNLICTTLHELAHAYTTKMYGHEVHRIGFIFYWIGMLAFTDTSDMWLSTREKRSIVSAAGPYIDVILAGMAGIIAYVSSAPILVLYWWFLAFLLYMSAFKNLNHIREGDGYSILIDISNNSNLRYDASTWLSQQLSRGNYLYEIRQADRYILLYWAASILFLMIALIIAMIIQHYFRLVLPDHLLGINTIHLAWILPLYVILVFYFIIKNYNR